MNFDIRQGNALDRLREIPDCSVNCCITSPPYFGLRDYGTAEWEGGSADCNHSRNNSPDPKNPNCGSANGRGPASQALNRATCAACGARRIDSQIGLESTPEQYIARLVGVFREVRRVLRDDGVLFVNIGDSYNAYNGGAGPSSSLSRGAQTEARPRLESGFGLQVKALKPKDLIGIPWMLAFALRADGWFLRQDLIWHKPNPMPESVKDRCTKAHEYIFLLSKSQRYWWDADAIREPSESTDPRVARSSRTFAGAVQRNSDLERYGTTRGRTNQPCCNENGRNKRSVWTIASLPAPEAHFATFPIDLPELCLKAGCPEGGTVLDPFSGAGTTGLACLKNGRNYIGIELNAAYIEIAHQRARKYYPLLIEATA